MTKSQPLFAQDGRRLTPADGREYFSAMGQRGGSKRRMRFHDPRRKAARPALPIAFEPTRHQDEEAPIETTYRFS